jgi:hypothetical protein
LTNFINYLLFFQKNPSLEIFPFSFLFFFSFLPFFFSFLSLLFSFLLSSLTYSKQSQTGRQHGAARADPPPWCPPSSASSPSPLAAPPLRPLHGRPQTSSLFFVGQLKQMHMTSHLLSPPSILSKMNSNLRILQDFIFN